MAENNDRVRLQLRVSADLKRQVEDYAKQLGAPANTAAIMLLVEGLRSTAERRDRS